jgi:DNA-binding response OmpR family regulator
MRSAGDSRHAEAVLVLDRDEAVRDIVAELAAAEGMRALPVSGEEEARLAFATYPGPIPFLVLDLRLASGDGFALGARLAGLRPGIRILYLSSRPREDFREFAHLRGQDVFLPKPFQLDALRDLMRGTPVASGA